MASIWKGAISFGLVTIPVQLEAAVRSTSTIHFRQLHRADLAPIKYERVCSQDGEPVAWADIVKGYEYAPDRFVVMEPEDLEAAAPPRSKLIEILDFVEATQVDPRYFDTPYILLPGPHGEKPYALLREAIRETGRLGIGMITLRNRQHLAAVRASGEALTLELMRFEAELVPLDSYTFPAGGAVHAKELAMARQLVENLSEPFDPSKYHDQYHERLQAIIDAKLAGKRIEIEEEAEPEGTRVVDLMARLQESLAMGKKGRAPRGARKASARKASRATPKRARQRKSA